MLPLEHSAILLTFIKLLFVIKTFVLPIFEWTFYTGFTVSLVCKGFLLRYLPKSLPTIWRRKDPKIHPQTGLISFQPSRPQDSNHRDP